MTGKLSESASDVKSKQIFEFLSVLSTYVRVRMEVKVYFLKKLMSFRHFNQPQC